MINIEYSREMNHNYLLVERPEDVCQDEFKHRMFESRKWDRFIPCSEKVINGKTVLYFEINSKVTLENYYSIKKMQISDMLNVLQGVEDAWKEASDYLMEEEDIIIDPKYIFYDMDKSECRFILHPWKDKDDGAPGDRIMPLLNYMLERADEDDGPTNDFIYRIYELAGHENFVLSDVLRDASNGSDDMDQCIVNEDIIKTDICRYDAGGVNRSVCKDDNVYGLSTMNAKNESVISGDRSGSCENLEIKHDRLLFSGGVLSFLFPGASLYMYKAYVLTQREKILLSAAAVSFIICGTVMLVTYFVRKALSGKKDNAKNDNAKKETGCVTDKYYAVCGMESSVSEKGPEYGSDDGRTVFLQPDREPASYKLYASDRKNSHHIELGRLPCVIGKQEGCVDEVIMNGGISRIHARVDHNGKCFTVTDLNSTNGTYVNGVRLEPDETMELSDGDEVRFGDLNYCLR